MKKLILTFLSFSAFLYAQFEIKNYLGFEYKSYIKKQKSKNDYNSALTFQSEIKYNFNQSKIYTKIDALKDSKDKNRDYFHLNELYYSKSFDDFDLDIGKKVIFLGALEANNIVDIFNRQNFQKDPLSKNKKGAIMANLNYFFENESILRLYIKGFEEDIKLGSKNSPYYPFTSDYDENVKFTNEYEKPSFLATYTSTYDEDIGADISFGLFKGYDENIIFKSKNSIINPYLFQSSKIFTYNTFVIDSTLYKFEASYTKPKANKIIKIDDFYQFGGGLEYTMEQIYKNHNLGLIAEYYKSDKNDLIFDNDLFLALRYSLNDQDSSEFLLGFIKDLKKSEKNEHSVYMKYQGRIMDNLNISTDLRYIKNNSYLDEHLRFSCEFKYYF